MPEDTQRKQMTLAKKLDRLFDTIHPGGRGEFTYQEVADGIATQGGPTISPSYIWQLRKGIKDNPRKSHLEALGKFFGVSPSYFFDEEAAERIDAELELLTKMRDARVKNIALRAYDLSPDTLRAIADIIEQARRIEGLPDGEGTGDASAKHDQKQPNEG